MKCVVRDIPINYGESGSGRPIVVLHGTPLDHRSMIACLEPIFSNMETAWRRIYVDLPGHGKTPGPDWSKSNDQAVEVSLIFINTIIPGERSVMIGESYGGYLARGVVHHLSDRVDGLSLWTSAIYPRSARKRPTRVVRVRDENTAAGLASESEKAIFSLFVVQSRDGMEFAGAHIIPGWDIMDEKFVESG
jgi:pimeloyl-ACP methyl ester carboxylesterase